MKPGYYKVTGANLQANENDQLQESSVKSNTILILFLICFFLNVVKPCVDFNALSFTSLIELPDTFIDVNFTLSNKVFTNELNDRESEEFKQLEAEIKENVCKLCFTCKILLLMVEKLQVTVEVFAGYSGSSFRPDMEQDMGFVKRSNIYRPTMRTRPGFQVRVKIRSSPKWRPLTDFSKSISVLA